MVNTMARKTGGHIARALLIVFCFVLALMSWPGTFAVQPSQAGIAGTVAEKICAAKMPHVYKHTGKSGVHSIDDLDSNHAISCNSYVSVCLQESGVLNKGEMTGHTNDGHSKGSIEDCVHNFQYVKAAADAGRCTYEFFSGGKAYGSLDAKYKQAGCVYICKGTANINVGEDKVYGCETTMEFSNVESDMERSALNLKDGTQSEIMAVIIPSHENSIIGAAYAAEEEETEDYDMYNVSSNAAAAFQDALGGALTKDGEEEPSEFSKGSKQAKKMIVGDAGDDTGAKTGNVCSYLGFADETKTKEKFKLSNLFQSKRTASSATFSYKQFRRMKAIIEGSDADGAYGFQSYANYGRMLADLGLDTTGSGTSIGRKVAGYVMMGAYLLASSVPFVFGYIAKFLSMLNPFVLLGEGANKLAASNSSLSELGKWTANLWDILQDMSLFVIIPLFFAFSFGIALLSHQPGGGSRIGNSFFQFIVRLIFITIAIPITGAIYTGFLNQLDGLAGYGTNASDGIIYSELVDFQGWASKTRLAPPSDVQFKWDTKEATAIIPDGSIRKVALSINALADHVPGDGGDSSTYYQNASGVSFSVPTTFGMYDLSTTEYTNGKSKGQSTSKAMELLKRYANGDVYSSSAYGSEVNADRQELMTKDEDKYEKYKKMFLEGEVDEEYPYTLAKDSIFGNGRLSCPSGGTAVYKLTSGSAKNMAEKDNRVTSAGGLSTVGMYNYLNSKFDDSEITTYSSKKSSSEYVKDSHFSVSAIGSGVWRALWYLQSFVTLLCMAVIGIIYAVSLVMTGLRQGGRMLASIPGAALGSMAFIGRFCAAFFVMIADILITIVFYSIFCELLQVVNEATSNIIPSGASSIALHVGGNSMPFMIGFSPLNFLGVIFSIFLILYVTWMAIRNRVVFIRSVDEVVSGSVGRMLGVKHGIGRGSKGGLLGAAAGTAAGVAAGHMISNKLDGKGKGESEGGAKGGGKGLLGGGGGGMLAVATGGSADDGTGAAGTAGDGGPGGGSGGGSGAGGGVDVGQPGSDSAIGGHYDALTDSSNDADMFGAGSSADGKMVGVDDLNNVDAETGAMSDVDGGATTVKTAQGSSTGGTGGAAGVAGRGGVVGGQSVNASKTAGGTEAKKASAQAQGGGESGGASTRSAGSMPAQDARSAKFYAGANKAAADVMSEAKGAQQADGFVKGMQSGAFKNGEFTGNAKTLAGYAHNGAKAAAFVDSYDKNSNAQFKKDHAGEYQKAKRQMAYSQQVLARAGVKGADSGQYMSPAQWNNVTKNISNAYTTHRQAQQTPGRITGQRTQAPGRSVQPTPGSGGRGGSSRSQSS